MKRLLSVAVAGALIASVPNLASASTIFLGTGTSSTDKGTVTLQVDSAADGYLAALTWDNSTLTDSTIDYILAASVKITSSDTTGASLDAAPGGTGDWLFYTDTGAANTCATGSQGSLCAKLIGSSSVTSTSGGPYTWLFDFDGVTLLPTDKFHAQINFHKTQGEGTSNISTEFSSDPVPEPASLILLGTGVAVFARRRRIFGFGAPRT